MSIRYSIGERGERPWGTWVCVAVGDNYITKVITVKPHSSLSLQMHNFRAEHWIVVAGTPRITIGESVQEYSFGESVDIPVNVKHRLENLSDDTVEVIEIQMGDVLDENDIIRFDDIYNRN